MQNQGFKEEMQDLGHAAKETQGTRNKNAVKKSSSIHKLDPVIENGLIRVGGRLHHAPINIYNIILCY